ncbi:MAG: ABC transporter permease [Desulfurococcaceae archaeon]
MFRDLRDVIVVASWDLMKLKNQRVFLAMRIAWFTVQVLVFARAISAIVSTSVKELVGGVDYYHFYLLGVYTALLYSTGISRGYIIADEFDDGVVEYHLSLPVKRGVFAVGRVVGSSLSALLFTLPMMLLVYAVLGVKNALTVLISVGAAMVFSAGVVCFVLLVVFTLKSTDLTDILMGAIDALLVRLSTVFYPLPVVEAAGIEPYYAVALLNPISHLADFFRVMAFPEYYLVVRYGLLPSLVYLVGLAMGLLVLAIEYYEKKLEAGGWK